MGTVVFKGTRIDLSGSLVEARVDHYRQPFTPLTPLTTNIKHPEFHGVPAILLWYFHLEFYLLNSSCFLTAMKNVLEYNDNHTYCWHKFIVVTHTTYKCSHVLQKSQRPR